MSKRRRWILIVLGTIQVLLAMYFGASSVYMQGSASNKLIQEKVEKPGALLTRSLSRIPVNQDLLKPDEDIRCEQGTRT